MKYAIILLSVLLSACSTNRSQPDPWVCSSGTEPIDAEVLFERDGRFYFDCLYNGDGGGDGDGGDGDGGNGAK